MINIQKDYKNFMVTIEKIINDNITYPGIIGTNGIFSNFRYFIEYILKSLDEFQTFKEKIENSVINIDNIETNNIIEIIKNNNNDFKEQEYIKKNKKNKINVNNLLSAKNKNHKIENIQNSKKTKNQTIDNEIKRSNFIYNDLLINNKINPPTEPIRNNEDKFNNNEKKKIKNIDYFSYKSNNRQKNEKSNSFDKNKNIIRLTNHHLINKNNDLKNIISKNGSTFLGQEKNNDNKNKGKTNLESLKIDYHINKSKNDSIKNNSLTNISSIKLKNAVKPDSSNKNNLNNDNNNKEQKFSFTQKKQINNISNNLNSFTTKTYFFRKNNTVYKRRFNIKKKNKIKDEIFTNFKFIDPTKNMTKRAESKLNRDLKSLNIIKAESNRTTYNNYDIFKRGKNKTWSFDRDNDQREEGVQFNFIKPFSTSNSNKEITILKVKNFKPVREVLM